MIARTFEGTALDQIRCDINREKAYAIFVVDAME